MRHLPAVQDLYLSNMAVSKKMYDKDRVRKDYDGVLLENFAPYGMLYVIEYFDALYLMNPRKKQEPIYNTFTVIVP